MWTFGVLDYFNAWSPLKLIPGYQDKGLMDNWSITMGANDRTTLLGPSMSFNCGASYSTSYDLVNLLLNPIRDKIPPPLKYVFTALLGNGDIKLVLGSSTSLLYGGPAGSSKRGPFWERIAGTWWDPQGKGAKYSASGSFSPSSVGKGSKDGLQFFERDQIFGEQVRDGKQLGVMLKTGKRMKIKTELANKMDLFADSFDVDAYESVSPLDDVKKDKFESDLAKCYTKDELKVLTQGDKAAKFGTLVLLLLDLGVNLVVIIMTKLENTSKMSRGSLAFSEEAAQKAYDAASNLKDNEKNIHAAENDLAWTKTVMLVRLIYKCLKIVGMQIIEIFENTERLARLVITNVDNCKDVNLGDYATNKFLSIEKRAETPQSLCDEADGLILREIKDRLGLTGEQLKKLTKEAVDELAGEMVVTNII